jgi:truncated hemoglobin YjbI
MPVPSFMPDSISEEQITVLVDTFYARVRQDETLGLSLSGWWATRGSRT